MRCCCFGAPRASLSVCSFAGVAACRRHACRPLPARRSKLELSMPGRAPLTRTLPQEYAKIGRARCIAGRHSGSKDSGTSGAVRSVRRDGEGGMLV
eukprot:170682-Prymnesium_polylepis.1